MEMCNKNQIQNKARKGVINSRMYYILVNVGIVVIVG